MALDGEPDRLVDGIGHSQELQQWVGWESDYVRGGSCTMTHQTDGKPSWYQIGKTQSYSVKLGNVAL